jgi:hypothetical protein
MEWRTEDVFLEREKIKRLNKCRKNQPVAWVLYQQVIDQSKAAIFINPGIMAYVDYHV